MASASADQDDIAIIGLSGLFPGSRNIEHFWCNILDKRDQIREAPDSWAMPWYDPDSTDQGVDSARIRTRKVGLIGDLAIFHPFEFGIPPKAIEGDPAHYLALQLAADALRDAGYMDRDFNRERTGVIVGHGSNPNRGDIIGMQYGLVIDQTLDLLGQLMPEIDTEQRRELRQALKRSLPPIGIEMAPTLISNVISGRISNRLDLMGPSYLVDSACSSSLIALDLGMRDLRSGRCDMMLIGGVQASMPAQIYMLFQQIGALAHSDIRPFDAGANGTLLSEGLGFAVIKRLADAVHDDDRIYAVLKGVGVASDGKAMGLLAPRLEGEVLAIRRAYEQTGIDPATIELIEAHGTGIPLGDRTEIQALSRTFGTRSGPVPQCAIGSVKSMIGHCIPAAGMASLIKTSLALHHKLLPPTLCSEVNPALGMERTPFYVNTETRPWVHGGAVPRRAGINAFGFGGINTHAILEEYRAPAALPLPGLGRWVMQGEERAAAIQAAGPMTDKATGRWSSELFVLAAESRERLLARIETLIRRSTEDQALDFTNLAHTLWRERGSGPVRLAVVAGDFEDLRAKLEQLRAKLPGLRTSRLSSNRGIQYAEQPTASGRIAFLFSSEGSQYPNMLLDLARHLPQVRRWFDFLDEIFPRAPRPSTSIFPAPTTLDETAEHWIQSQLHTGDLATESIRTVDNALYELICDLGIKADVMVGHSIGEYVALSASGMVRSRSRSLDALRDELRRLNDVYHELEKSGVTTNGILISLGAVDQESLVTLLREFEGSLYLVADNCPNQKLLFARPESRDPVFERISQLGGIYAEMPFDRSYHTILFEEGARALQKFYNEYFEFTPGHTTVYSCGTAAPYPNDTDGILEVAAAQWKDPVRFRETMEALYRDDVRIFIEIGANNTLTSFVEDIFKGREYVAVSSSAKNASSLEKFQQMLGRLYVEHIEMDLEPLYSHRNPVSSIDKADENSAENKKNTSFVLKGDLPLLRLDEKFQEHWIQEHTRTSSRPVHDSCQTMAAQPELQNAKNLFREEMLQQHFDLMKQFLAGQTKVAEFTTHALNRSRPQKSSET